MAYIAAMASGRPQPFRVVVLDDRKQATTVLVTLDRAPDIGSELELQPGSVVKVRQVVTADHPDVAGVIIARPA